MNEHCIPPVLQAVGVACVPLSDMPANPLLARKPVAAAIITVSLRSDGHREVTFQVMSDELELELPLQHLLDQGLIAGAPVLIADGDRSVLALEATSRRFFVELKLAALVAGRDVIDPATAFGVAADEAALFRRLDIPASVISDRDVELAWNRGAPQVAEEAALMTAVSRLMLWAHLRSFQTARPDPFFELLLPLRERLLDIEADHPAVGAALRSRPLQRAVSMAASYREYRAARAAGDETARWVTFEKGVFHT